MSDAAATAAETIRPEAIRHRRRRALSLQGGFLVLVFATVLPLVVLFGLKDYRDYQADRARQSVRTLEVTRVMAQAVAARLQGYLAGVQTLAQADTLRNDNLDGFAHQAEAFLTVYPGTALSVLDRNGMMLRAWGDGMPLALPAGARTNNNAMARALQTQRPVVSDFFAGTLSNRPSFSIISPVMRDGRVIYVLSLNPFAQSMQRLIAEEHLPPDWIVSIFDSAGVTVAREPDAAGFVGRRASELLYPKLMTQREDVCLTTTLTGSRVEAAFSHVAGFGWSVAIGVPDAVLVAPFWRSLIETVGLAVLGLLLTGAVAYALFGRVLGPMRALAKWAASPETVALPPSLGLREADDLAWVLRTSTQEMRQMTDTLEVRVRKEEEAREQAEAQLVHAQRMEALGKLAGGIAHDVNNILQVISGALEFIERRPDNPRTAERFSRLCSDAVRRGSAVTSRLLTFARSGSLQAEPVSPRALLDDLREMLAPTLGPNITVIVAADPALPRLQADKDQLATAIVNLAVNARDAMPNGGTLMLSATLETADKGLDRPRALGDGTFVRVDVTDTGTGMDRETLVRASELFYTTKEAGKGTGLGLAMVRGFAEQSGGGLAISSVPAQGTTVTLWLPLAEAAAPRVTEAAAEVADHGAEAASGRVLLLVDDDPMVGAAVAAQLEARGHTVLHVLDGFSAVDRLEREEAPDLIITDFAMPRMNGLALIEEARRRLPRLPAILLTGHADATVQFAAMAGDRSATRLVRKPVSGDELAREVSVLMRARASG